MEQNSADVVEQPVTNPLQPQPDEDMNHLPRLDLSWMHDEGWIKGSEIYLSTSPNVDSVVVFVHGWGGDPRTTWKNFQTEIRKSAEYSGIDFIFFGYPSLKHTVAFCAAKLRHFLDDLFSSPAPFVLNSSILHGLGLRQADFQYKRVIFFAHSMGAVILRRALLDLERSDKFQKSRPLIRLVLFAPAHKGASLPLMITDGLGLEWIPGAKFVANLLRLHYRSLNDLARGSATLARLEEDHRSTRTKLATKMETLANIDLGHFYANVLHAQSDRVVEQEPFDEDPPFIPVMQRHHRNICKPNDAYRKPIEALVQAIRKHM